MTTHLYAGPGDFPETLCPANKAWKHPEPAVYFCDLDKVDCPDCLGRVEIPTAEPYTEHDAARLRRGLFWSAWFAVPFWVALFVAVWRWIA